MKVWLIILVVLIFLLPLVVFSNSWRIRLLENTKKYHINTNYNDVEHIEITYSDIDNSFILVGRKVTLLNHPQYKGLIGKPMQIIAVNKPFVMVRWKSILGDYITDPIDLRESVLIPISDNYAVADRTVIEQIFPEWVDENGWGYYDFRVQYVLPGAYDPNFLSEQKENE